MAGSDGIELTPKLACEYRMPFGKHKGKSLRDIAVDGDVLYLDWLVGQDSKSLYESTRNILKTFLSIEWVSRMVEDELAKKGD